MATEQLIAVMAHSSALTREQIWHPELPYSPTVRTEFSSLARSGYVGTNWKAGGYTLIGSNGNSTEGHLSANAIYKEQDLKHAELIRAFRDAPNFRNHRALMDFERKDITTWSLRSTIDKVIERLNVDWEDVAILNVIPFSTIEASRLPDCVWKNSVEMHLAPLLDILKPERVIWLGKNAFKSISRYKNLLPEFESYTPRE
jgi:hypothetical protein